MSISATCPGCNARFELPDDLAGESVRCEKCGEVFEVPKLAEAPSPAPTEAVVMAAVVEPIDEKPTPPTPAPKTRVPAERPESMARTLALVLLFVIGVLGAGVVATSWID